MDELRIHLLGGFLLEWGDHPVPPIPSRLGRSLLAYLVINRNRPQMRDYLGGMFWPELSEGRARRRLSHTLWQVQDALSEVCDPQRFLTVTPDDLAFTPRAPYWLDVEEFERTLEEVGRPDPARAPAADLERLRHCVELYRGDLLAWVLRGVGRSSNRTVISNSSSTRSNNSFHSRRLMETTKRHSPTPAG